MRIEIADMKHLGQCLGSHWAPGYPELFLPRLVLAANLHPWDLGSMVGSGWSFKFRGIGTTGRLGKKRRLDSYLILCMETKFPLN